MPRIVIFGAGAIGCWVGGRLAVGGADVTLVGRPRVLGELERGLQVSELGGGQWTVQPAARDRGRRRRADPRVHEVRADRRCCACARGHDRRRSSACRTACATSDVLREALPGRAVLAGMVPFNVVRRGPGSYHRGSGGTLAVEHDELRRRSPRRACAPTCALDLRDDMLAVQWAKLVMNLNNAINALSGMPLATELAQRGYRVLLAAAQREALDVLARRARQARARDARAAALDAAPARPARLGCFAGSPGASSRSIRTRGRRCGTTSRPSGRQRSTTSRRDRRARRAPRHATRRSIAGSYGSSARPKPAASAISPRTSCCGVTRPTASRRSAAPIASDEQRVEEPARSSAGVRATAPCRSCSSIGSSARRNWRTSASKRSQSRAARNHHEPRFASSATPSSYDVRASRSARPAA